MVGSFLTRAATVVVLAAVAVQRMGFLPDFLSPLLLSGPSTPDAEAGRLDRVARPARPDSLACSLSSAQRMVFIGDVHGDAKGLATILKGAGLIAHDDDGLTCARAPSSFGTTVVQVGDIVDRGEHALEAWDCLSNLQATSPAGSEVVRLVGNHELMWLYGDHKVTNNAHAQAEGLYFTQPPRLSPSPPLPLSSCGC